MISIVGDSVHRTSTGNRNCAKCRTVGKSPRGRFQRYLAFKVDPFFEIVYSSYPWPPPSRGPRVASYTQGQTKTSSCQGHLRLKLVPPPLGPYISRLAQLGD